MKMTIGPSICLGMAALFCIQSGWAAPEATGSKAPASEVATMPSTTDAQAPDVQPMATKPQVDANVPTSAPTSEAPAATAPEQPAVDNAPVTDQDASLDSSNNGDTMTQQSLTPEQFMAENAKQEGVQVTDSGLQYKVLKAGTGPHPKADDMVTVQYEGRLTDGTVFDSSYKRGQPAQFGLNQVIQGWTEGLQLMSEGATYELYIPASLAYGPNGIPGVIPPNSPLVFKVELIKVSG